VRKGGGSGSREHLTLTGRHQDDSPVRRGSLPRRLDGNCPAHGLPEEEEGQGGGLGAGCSSLMGSTGHSRGGQGPTRREGGGGRQEASLGASDKNPVEAV